MHGHFLLQTLKSTDECIVSSLVSLVTVTSKVSNYFVILLLWGRRAEKLWEEEVAMVRGVSFCMPVKLKWQYFGDQWWIRAKTKFDLFKFWNVLVCSSGLVSPRSFFVNSGFHILQSMWYCTLVYLKFIL